MFESLTNEGAKILLHFLHSLDREQVDFLYHKWEDYQYEKLKLIQMLKEI